MYRSQRPSISGFDGKPFIGKVTRISLRLDRETRNMRTDRILSPYKRGWPAAAAGIPLIASATERGQSDRSEKACDVAIIIASATPSCFAICAIRAVH
jgi:hypothetical protein